ncbi:MAG: quinone-dependent dihydroorotate dehydrogenase [Gammaproteobacteria bacterium]|nr:quinone-dependent dihydroorotate dehydrogenase [Gammaproteobacteria bacterium]
MLYSLIKPMLFSLDPELAHDLSLGMLQRFHRLLPRRRFADPVRVMGLEFPNRVGLAAGLDKNGDYLDGLARLGFGFIEIGSITPRAQPGNPKPRVFRLARHQSLINRMGFNNAGVDHLLQQVAARRDRDYLLGINIGKNLATPVADALDDYRAVLQRVYTAADYVTINISSPNTPGLRDLQNEDALDALLAGIGETRRALEDEHQLARPLAVKLSPDLDTRALPALAELLQRHTVDGLILTNTTLSRAGVEDEHHAVEAGGLSGAALREQACALLAEFRQALDADFPIVSVGGIDSAQEARRRLDLGASLVQLYTGLIYHGPGLVGRIAAALAQGDGGGAH